jgi:hypothetical protein
MDTSAPDTMAASALAGLSFCDVSASAESAPAAVADLALSMCELASSPRVLHAQEEAREDFFSPPVFGGGLAEAVAEAAENVADNPEKLVEQAEKKKPRVVKDQLESALGPKWAVTAPRSALARVEEEEEDEKEEREEATKKKTLRMRSRVPRVLPTATATRRAPMRVARSTRQTVPEASEVVELENVAPQPAARRGRTAPLRIARQAKKMILEAPEVGQPKNVAPPPDPTPLAVAGESTAPPAPEVSPAVEVPPEAPTLPQPSAKRKGPDRPPGKAKPKRIGAKKKRAPAAVAFPDAPGPSLLPEASEMPIVVPQMIQSTVLRETVAPEVSRAPEVVTEAAVFLEKKRGRGRPPGKAKPKPMTANGAKKKRALAPLVAFSDRLGKSPLTEGVPENQIPEAILTIPEAIVIPEVPAPDTPVKKKRGRPGPPKPPTPEKKEGETRKRGRPPKRQLSDETEAEKNGTNSAVAKTANDLTEASNVAAEKKKGKRPSAPAVAPAAAPEVPEAKKSKVRTEDEGESGKDDEVKRMRRELIQRKFLFEFKSQFACVKCALQIESHMRVAQFNC